MKQSISFFENYKFYKTRINAKRMELDMVDNNDTEIATQIMDDIADCQRKMNEIEHAVATHTDHAERGNARQRRELREEQLFLESRYIAGMTMEKTAEAMHVSRDTAYRIRRRLV